MSYKLADVAKRFEISANSIRELEVALSYLNPLQLSHANVILKREYQLVAVGLGPDIECISYKKAKAHLCEISIVYVKSHKQANQ